jgi:hypothetical protein
MLKQREHIHPVVERQRSRNLARTQAAAQIEAHKSRMSQYRTDSMIRARAAQVRRLAPERLKPGSE